MAYPPHPAQLVVRARSWGERIDSTTATVAAAGVLVGTVSLVGRWGLAGLLYELVSMALALTLIIALHVRRRRNASLVWTGSALVYTSASGVRQTVTFPTRVQRIGIGRYAGPLLLVANGTAALVAPVKLWDEPELPALWQCIGAPTAGRTHCVADLKAEFPGLRLPLSVRHEKLLVALPAVLAVILIVAPALVLSW